MGVPPWRLLDLRPADILVFVICLVLLSLCLATVPLVSSAIETATSVEFAELDGQR